MNAAAPTDGPAAHPGRKPSFPSGHLCRHTEGEIETESEAECGRTAVLICPLKSLTVEDKKFLTLNAQVEMSLMEKLEWNNFLVNLMRHVVIKCMRCITIK